MFHDSRGRLFNAVRRTVAYPAHVFYSKTGRRIYTLRGYPFPATPRG